MITATTTNSNSNIASLIKPTNPSTQGMLQRIETDTCFDYINCHHWAVEKKIKSADMRVQNVGRDILRFEVVCLHFLFCFVQLDCGNVAETCSC